MTNVPLMTQSWSHSSWFGWWCLCTLMSLCAMLMLWRKSMAVPMSLIISEASGRKRGKDTLSNRKQFQYHTTKDTSKTDHVEERNACIYSVLSCLMLSKMSALYCSLQGIMVQSFSLRSCDVFITQSSPFSVKAWSPLAWIRLNSSPPSILETHTHTLKTAQMTLQGMMSLVYHIHQLWIIFLSITKNLCGHWADQHSSFFSVFIFCRTNAGRGAFLNK